MSGQAVHMSALAEYTGTLLHNAESRQAEVDGEGHYMPVLCLDIELDTPLRTHMHVEQLFKDGQFKQAHFAAQRLKKGMRVTVQAPLTALRLIAANTTHIHVIHDDKPQESAAPCHP